jgi:hypothetical protein
MPSPTFQPCLLANPLFANNLPGLLILSVVSPIQRSGDAGPNNVQVRNLRVQKSIAALSFTKRDCSTIVGTNQAPPFGMNAEL